MSDFQCIELTNNDDVSIVRLVDDKVIDAERIQRLGEELLSLSKGDENRKLLINMANVRFLSSSAINKLIKCFPMKPVPPAISTFIADSL